MKKILAMKKWMTKKHHGPVMYMEMDPFKKIPAPSAKERTPVKRSGIFVKSVENDLL